MSSIKTEIAISASSKKEDYEILIKQKFDKGFVAYSPQIFTLVKGETYDAVLNQIEEKIKNHIDSLDIC